MALFGFGGCGGGGGGGEGIPAEEYDLADLQGEWLVEGGSGTATGADGPYSLSLEGGYFKGFLLEETENVAWVQVDYSLLCRATNPLGQSVSLQLRDAGEARVNKVGVNSYRYVFPGGSQLTVTLLSETRARVQERGTLTVNGYPYTYSGSYSFRKKTG